jgi:hypothetical protein
MVPTLRKVREGWGTRTGCIGGASEIKNLGHPANLIEIRSILCKRKYPALVTKQLVEVSDELRVLGSRR